MPRPPATDVSGLPDTYIDVGDLDIFRDEDIAYARRLSDAGYRPNCTCIRGARTRSKRWRAGRTSRSEQSAIVCAACAL